MNTYCKCGRIKLAHEYQCAHCRNNRPAERNSDDIPMPAGPLPDYTSPNTPDATVFNTPDTSTPDTFTGGGGESSGGGASGDW